MTVTLLVVAAFVGAEVYSQARTAAMDQRAAALVDGIAPSIERLAAARGTLHRMVAAARDAAAGRAAGDEAARLIDAERSRLDGHLDAFLEHETAPPSLRDQAMAAMDAVESRAQSIARMLVAHDLTSARAQANTLDALAEEADQSMEQLVLWNAAETSRDGAAIRDARRHASFVSYALHGAASALALAALAIAVGFVRRADRLEQERNVVVDERNRLAEARALELDAFASRVAHDIKNPLSVMSMRVSLAQDPNAGAETIGQSLDSIQACIRILNRTVDDLLSFAQAGGRPTPDKNKTASIGAVLAAIVEEVKPSANALGAELVVEDGSSGDVACAPGVLLSVVGNLVRNAIKFLPEGEGARRIELRATEANGRTRVEVEDTGPGIARGREQEIFASYVRGETSRPGLGLGLATVKRLVEAHGGTVGVRPGKERGSCFWFELPRAG